MVEPARIRYRESVGASDFAKTLTLRVNAYFDERGISRNANLEMISKTVLGFLLLGRVDDPALASAAGG